MMAVVCIPHSFHLPKAAAAADAVTYCSWRQLKSCKNITAPSTAAISVTENCVLKRNMTALDSV